MATSTHFEHGKCHWEVIKGPHNGRTPGTMVWICEYPYRTIRFGPSDDCEGCRRAAGLDATRPATQKAIA